METPPGEFYLKGDVTPMCSRPYPVQRIHKAMLKKEFERLVELGFIEEANDYEWRAPSFNQPKPKINCVRFLSVFQNLNRQIKRKPYPMQKICEMLLNL